MTTTPGGPLAGVRVLDLTRFPPGAYCTTILADLGATVCRVDAPGSTPAMSGIGVALSRAKKSVALDLRHARGNDVLRRLAAWADVLVENHRPGDLDARGFGYSHAATELPRLVWCSLSGFGQDGPYATWAGHDITYTAHSGLLHAIDPELPWHPQQVLAVPAAAMTAATGIAAALFERASTGRGCQLDISISEAATGFLSSTDGALTDSSWGIPVSPQRRLYECGDGNWLTVAAAEPRTWAALCRGLGLDDLADERPSVEQSATVTARLAAAFATRPAADWVAELGPLGAAVGPVNQSSQVVRDPQVVARGAVVEVDGVPVPANPIRMRDAEGARSGTSTASPPGIGADTDAILGEAGYTPAEIAGLRAEGAIP
jgi:crotonobetainyl-CoA:carnitine CoA-transferase CaiB-like acyl-CoA transferase